MMKKMNYRREEMLPSYSVIQAATEGDVAAINLILKHYERYILKLSTRMLYDKTGRLCYEVDERKKKKTMNSNKIYLQFQKRTEE